MKLLIYLISASFFLFGLNHQTIAQTEREKEVTVTGKVLYQGKGISSASILVFSSADSTLYKAAVTDTAGVFRIHNLSNGGYYFTIEAYGYKHSKKMYFMADSSSLSINLNDILLDSLEYKSLQEVMVTSSKRLVEQKIDRIVFNVENSITASNGNGLEAIGKAPGVRVDQKGISLIGKSSLGVMINDRLVQLSGDDLSDYLKSIPASNIAAIEVITNPPSSYSADGHSGLLNIKLKKTASEGLNGTVRAGYTQTTYPMGDLGGTFNYRKGKLNIYGNLTYTKGSSAPVENLTIYYPDQTWDQFDYRKDKVNTTVYQLGADYNIGKNSLLGIIYNASYRLPEINENIHTAITNLSKVADSLIRTSANTQSQINSNAFNLNYDTKLGKRKTKLSLDVDYLVYSNNKHRDFTTQNLYPDGIPTSVNSDNRTLSDQLIHISTAKADISFPLKTGSNLSFGSKVSFINTTSSDALQLKTPVGYQVDSSNTNEFKYTENTQAAYVNADKTFGKLSVQLGLRGEYTQLTGNSLTLSQKNNSQYFKLFPTAYLLYNQNDDNSYSFSYGRRIYRPGYRELDPFRWYLNKYQYSEGNPFLQPSFSDNIEIGYSYKSKYYFTAYYEGIDNYSDQIILTDSTTKISSFLRKNIGNSQSYGIRIQTEDNFYSSWTMSNQLIIYDYHFHSTYDNQPAPPSKTTAYFSSTNEITLDRKKNLSCEISGWYQLPQRSGYDYIQRTYGINAGVQLLLLEKKLTLSITGNDLLKSDKPFIITNALGNHSTSNNYYDVRRIKITAIYKFGSNKVKSKRSRSTGNGDEKNRIG